MSYVRVRVIGPDGKLSDPREVPKLVLSDAEWCKRLTPEQDCLNSEALRFVAGNQLKTIAEPASNWAAAGAVAADDIPRTERAEAVFAGGCFWCVEAVFRQLKGVLDVTSGYAGGTAETANYEAVSAGRTGHAEAVKIVYDPRKLSYEQLLKVHFATHDPTTLNRQGNDIGTQYRSAIFYANDEQRQLAEAMIADLNHAKVYRRRLATVLEPLRGFYSAEAKHQNFVACNLHQPYVQAVAMPKVAKVRAKFKDLLKSPQDATIESGAR